MSTAGLFREKSALAIRRFTAAPCLLWADAGCLLSPGQAMAGDPEAS